MTFSLYLRLFGISARHVAPLAQLCLFADKLNKRAAKRLWYKYTGSVIL